MTKRVIILHGTMGSPEGNWFRWLQKELQDRGYEVWLPVLPHAEQPSLREWADYVHEHAPFQLDEQTLIIGHSSGAILALIAAQESSVSLSGVVAVSVFHDNSLNWDANSRLFDIPYDFEAIKRNAPKLLFIHSDNDPYVPLEQAQYVSEKCGSNTLVIPGQGHFNLEQSPGYAKFPKLIEVLEASQLL